MDVKQAFEYFRLLEQQFWKHLDKKTVSHITFNGELKSQDMLLYGEFGFTLLGLKPAMLVEFRDSKINALYLETVIDPVLFALKSKTLNHYTIKDIKTPESNLNGCVLVYQISQQQGKELTLIMSKTTELTEEQMAALLDYPGHLPSCEKEIPTMQSVIYFEDTASNGLVALTSFAIQDMERDKTLDHFKRYRSACKDRLNIELKLMLE